MCIKRKLKQCILSAVMNKQKKKAPFDIEYSDNYQLADDADWDINNSHYFTAHGLQTGEAFFLRLGLRGGNYPDEVWFMYRSPLGEIYLSEKDHYDKKDGVPALVTVVKAGKELRFNFNGNLKRGILTEEGHVPDKTGDSFPAEFNGVFIATDEPFEFSRHMATKPVARALSYEKFNDEFKKSLSHNHQVHYEQSGMITGELKTDGKTIKFENLSGFRDHSYGRRDWSYFDRHVWLMGLLENGDFFHTSLIRYPAVKRLQAGFYRDRNNSVVSLDKATDMYDMPVTGSVPQKFSFDVKYINGKRVHVEVERDFMVPYYFGEGKYYLVEGVSSFTVNGVKGRGITEFGFNTDKSRWGS